MLFWVTVMYSNSQEMNACAFVCERIKKKKYSKDLSQTVYLSHMTHKNGKHTCTFLHWFRHAALLRNVNASSPCQYLISSYFLPLPILSSFHLLYPERTTRYIKGYYLFTQAPNPYDFHHTRNFQHKKTRLLLDCVSKMILRCLLHVLLNFQGSRFKVQGFFICHMINYTGYNQKWNVGQIRSAQWTVQRIKIK